MGSQRGIARLQQEMATARRLQQARLARDYVPEARRLREAYVRIIERLSTSVSAFEGGTLPLEILQGRIAKELGALQTQITTSATNLQAAGIRSGVELGTNALARGGMGVRFNQPTLDSIRAVINYVDSAAFKSAVTNLGAYHAEVVADAIIAGQAQGWNPTKTANYIRRYFGQSRLPLVDAQRLTRTTQIYSARRGNQEVYRRNGIKQWIWSANIGDSRTCVMCYFMHGSVHPIEELLNEHHNGRCAPIPVTPTWEALGFIGGQDIAIARGGDLLARMPLDFQRTILGPSLFDAWNRGVVILNENTISTTYNNPIFGAMRRRKTNAELLTSATQN